LFTLFQGLSDELRGASGLPPVAFQRGGCITLGPTFEPFKEVGNLDERNVPWRVSANWKVTPDTLLYANISKGYKAGEFGTFGATNYYQYQPVKQESVLAYEVGVKAPLLGPALVVDAAAFYYDYVDKQLRGNIILPIFGPLETVVNIPKSHVEGAEFDVQGRPISGLTLMAGATYLRSRVDGSFQNYTPYGVPTNFEGLQFPYTPNWQLVGDSQYDWALQNGYTAFVGGNVLYVSDTSGAFAGGPLLAIKSYATLDLRAGVALPDGHWTITLWGQNVTNTYYWTNATFPPPDTTIRYAGRPATYGIRFSMVY
jgi:outer membrane receptor protein involved in Fe transport